ncbi:uncharacterized protein LOC121827918 [Peromyscus maniculatus bairdii]|uniref:uncharacterized protein LOC121827918 n=1 Tax=Peromyscus maniculatus bairdii TaxID=230844 RepID=UPI003FD55CA9
MPSYLCQFSQATPEQLASSLLPVGLQTWDPSTLNSAQVEELIGDQSEGAFTQPRANRRSPFCNGLFKDVRPCFSSWMCLSGFVTETWDVIYRFPHPWSGHQEGGCADRRSTLGMLGLRGVSGFGLGINFLHTENL